MAEAVPQAPPVPNPRGKKKDPEWWSQKQDEETTTTKGGGCGCKNKHKAAAAAAAPADAPCPHCGKSEPGSCPKCAGKKAETPVEEEPATAAPVQEPFVVTEDMVWQEDEL